MSAAPPDDDDVDVDGHVEDHSLENDERTKNWGRKLDGSGPGRQRGSSAKQRANFRIKYAIQCKGPAMVRNLFKLSVNRDPYVRLAALKMLFLYGYGRPTIHVDVSGTVTKRYVAVMPPTLEHEEWMKMVHQQGGTIMPASPEPSVASTNGHPHKS